MASFRVYTHDTTQEALEALWPGAGITENGRRDEEQAWLVEMEHEDADWMENLLEGAEVVIRCELLDAGEDEEAEEQP
jgi:hypothetical protein